MVEIEEHCLVSREVAPRCGACGCPDRAAFYEPGDIVECLGCGVLYVSPRPTASAIAAFYSAAGHYDHWDEEPGRAAMWARRVARIEKLVPSGRLLDIGAGQGDFGAAARAAYDVDGTEVSSEGQRLAKERHGLDLRLGDALELELPQAHYDVITLWHVLEHVAEPGALLARCHALLKPGGVVCVAVPNTNARLLLTRATLKAKLSFGARQLRNGALPLPRLELKSASEEVHLTHFTLRTLVEALERSGFDVVERGLDDHSADNGPKSRAVYRRYAGVYRALRVPLGPAIFAAGKKLL